MSSTARWANTAKATLWARLSRDGWTGAQAFAAPVVIDCDYSGKAQQMRDNAGVEFVASLVIYTEHEGIKMGDRVALGVSVLADPIAAGAREVRGVIRHADTFERLADDYEVGAA